MTAAINKLQASLATATQETTLALANLNFDFSLFRVEAPPEYRPFGAALSLYRRSEAENGMPHVIARRLGTLFETLLPPTNALIHAYGTRASEISQSPGVNPTGGKTHGPFAKYIGLDGTSIWAAATSGPAAVAVHLLACMLARVWSPAEAVSIWEEMVAGRKESLMPAADAEYINTKDVAAAQVSITKEQLADWDASARAWLRAADTASVTKKQQKQFMSVLNSINMPVGNQPKVYDGVCKAWLNALTTIDKLVQGASYSIQDGAVLVALSAWHLYPDIIVLGNTSQEIHQQDALIPSSATLTIGLQSSVQDGSRGVHWSLSLAHLRYYGSPVAARGTVASDSSRIAFPHFIQAVLGAVIGLWGVDMSLIAQSIKLMTLLNSCLESTNANSSTPEYPTKWIRLLADAAEHHLNAHGEEAEICTRLVRLGYRRPTFLAKSKPSQAFYLKCLDISCLMNNVEEEVMFFRSIFKNWDTNTAPLVLRISYRDKTANGAFYCYTSVTPLATDSSGKEKRYVTWLGSKGAPTILSPATAGEIRLLDDAVDVTNKFIATTFGWKNAPDLLIPSQSVNVVEASDEPKSRKEPSRWGFKKQKEQSSIKAPRPEARFEFVAGSVSGVALFAYQGYQAEARRHGDMSVNIHTVLAAFQRKAIDPTYLSNHLQKLAAESEHSDLFFSLSGVAAAIDLYQGLPGATISPSVISSRPLFELAWIGNLAPIETSANSPSGTTNLTREAAFSCIAYLETGSLDIMPRNLDNVMAISTGDSLYVAAPLIVDPASQTKPYEIHRVVGNIGRAGMAFLIPPQQPMVRIPSTDKWNVINHEMFDGKLEDNFSGTTLHLSFTGYENPMMDSSHGGRFVNAFIIEAVVSVHDSGEWVADLDVLKTLKSSNLYALVQQPTCEKSSPAGSIPNIGVITIDNWDELLDPPRNIAVVRAHGNWQARLAAANISVMLGHPTILFQGHGCWTCAVKLMQQLGRSVQRTHPMPTVTTDPYGATADPYDPYAAPVENGNSYTPLHTVNDSNNADPSQTNEGPALDFVFVL